MPAKTELGGDGGQGPEESLTGQACIDLPVGQRNSAIWAADGLVQVLTGHDGPVMSVAWSPHGRLASGSDDKTVRVWPQPRTSDELLALVKEAHGLRQLTAERLHGLFLPVHHGVSMG